MKFPPIAGLLLLTSLAACSSPTHQDDVAPALIAKPVATQPQAASTPANATAVGNYHGKQLSGDYAGYASVQQFIDRMVQKHAFKREYLVGLFSQAHRKNWTLNYLAKSDQAMKGKPVKGGWSKYRAQFLDERHIGAGVDFARRHRDALQRASQQYGVPEEYILGIMAVETTFGSNVGNHRVLDALTTLSFDYPRRSEFFQGELEDYLLMTRNEGLDPAQPVGSFAGAMGLGQFMPSSFLQWAVDFDGDGRRDLWGADDAIGSVANYFAQHGWQAGGSVVTPLRSQGEVNLQTGIETQYTPEAIRQAGLVADAAYSDNAPLHLLLLRYADHDEYLAGHANFYTITRYNHSTHYAMAVHELAQAIKRRL
jgi:membrane-bound lytic murein transglycosylase B